MDIRKSALDLSQAERDDFLTAMFKLKHKPAFAGASFSVYDQFAALHLAAMREITIAQPGAAPAQVNVAHRNIAFFPWHREYIRRFEVALQQEVPGVTLPYWDWSAHTRNLQELFTDDFLGPVLPAVPSSNPAASPLFLGPQPITTGAFGFHPPSPLPSWWPANAVGWRIHRVLQERESAWYPAGFPNADELWATLHRGSTPNLWPPSAQQIEILADLHDTPHGFHHYWLFWGGCESGSVLTPVVVTPPGAPPMIAVAAQIATHNAGHNWLGGHMGRAASPNDPVFWLHHAQVDRIWALWQELHGQPPHSADLIDDYPPTGTDNPVTRQAVPLGHRLEDPMWPWIGSLPGYTPLATPPLRDMLIDYSGEPVRHIKDVFRTLDMGYQYQEPL